MGPRNVPKILVGTKKDVRDEMQNSHVGNIDEIVFHSDGLNAVEEFKFFSYIETSAKTLENVSKVFYESIRANYLIKE